MRAALAVANELSLPEPGQDRSDEELAILIESFVRMLIAARRIRPDLALVSQVPFGGAWFAGDGRTIAAFAEAVGGRALESWRFILTMRNHAPFAAAPGVKLEDGAEEYRFAGAVAIGLGLAGANDQLGVSFQVAEAWEAPNLELDRVSLEEVGEDIIEQHERIQVKHASSVEHVETHAEFLRRLALPRPFSGADLWRDRANQYPHLAFLTQVQDQLSSLIAASTALKGIAERLAELEAAAAEWDPATSAFPNWRSEVTPEAEQRKRLCMFTDLDGVRRCFDLHARYTPGAGRIHVRLTPSSAGARLTVGYIGLKIVR